jgi:pimeloyl-ACP methyl ester carboxylesterase
MAMRVRDGVQLHFVDEGKGQAVVFIHPWGGDTRYFAPQVERFRAGRRAIAVDLRGHGVSDAPRGSYTVKGFVDDVAWLLAELGVESPIVVGNSLGGVVALELGGRGVARAVACLDAPVVPPAGLMEGFRPLAEALHTPAYREALRGFTEQLGGFADRPELRAWLMDQFLGNQQHVMSSALDDILVHDTTPAAASCKVPLLYVSAGPWYTDVARLRELCPQLLTAQTVGSGHYHELEVPEQVNAILARFFDMVK